MQFIEHTIFNISDEKKSTMFRKKSQYFFFDKRKKSHISVYFLLGI